MIILMNEFGLGFLLLSTVALFLLPRHWAPIPLLFGTCYMSAGQGVELGTLSFGVVRILIAAGVLRVLVRREWPVGVPNAMDKLMILWAIWIIFSSHFHENSAGAVEYGLGYVYNVCGIYFLARSFCRSTEDLLKLCGFLPILLFPLALEMLWEVMTSRNLCSTIYGIPYTPTLRAGRLRAQGPFLHAILAGTVGAACLPLTISLWVKHRKKAILGITACTLMVITSASSGPILTAAAALAGVCSWKFRNQLKLVRRLSVLAYLGLDLVMKAPAYFIIARIDFTGGSTGWHRSQLIYSAFEHISEWWHFGTDYTRHWMPTGVSWSPNHADITNHYLSIGIRGGLPSLLFFLAILVKAFSFVGQSISEVPEKEVSLRFSIWMLGATLFAHCVTFLGVSYFDQSFVFIYLTLGLIGSIRSASSQLSQLPNQDTQRSKHRHPFQSTTSPADLKSQLLWPSKQPYPRNLRKQNNQEILPL